LKFGQAYREDKIDNVHQNKNSIAGAHLPVSVGKCEQEDRDDVVREHLPVVLATFFNIDDEDLLYPERRLREVV
jgi:hypothetical protein